MPVLPDQKGLLYILAAASLAVLIILACFISLKGALLEAVFAIIMAIIFISAAEKIAKKDAEEIERNKQKK